MTILICVLCNMASQQPWCCSLLSERGGEYTDKGSHMHNTASHWPTDVNTRGIRQMSLCGNWVEFKRHYCRHFTLCLNMEVSSIFSEVSSSTRLQRSKHSCGTRYNYIMAKLNQMQCYVSIIHTFMLSEQGTCFHLSQLFTSLVAD